MGPKIVCVSFGTDPSGLSLGFQFLGHEPCQCTGTTSAPPGVVDCQGHELAVVCRLVGVRARASVLMQAGPGVLKSVSRQLPVALPNLAVRGLLELALFTITILDDTDNSAVQVAAT